MRASESSHTHARVMNLEAAQQRLLFRGLEPGDVARWHAQNIVLVPGQGYLAQHSGGPCGVLAVLQAFTLAHAHFPSSAGSAPLPEEALLDAMVEIVQCAAAGEPFRVVVTAAGMVSTTTSAVEARALLKQANFAQGSGVVRFVMSVVASRTAERVLADMDDAEGALTGRFGHCGSELINLLITGRAASQMHDGVMKVEGGLELRGIEARPRVGFLTHLEALRLSKVGAFLKNPELPIWVLGSESHFTVLFSTDAACDAKTSAQQALEKGQRAFAQLDSSENGFVDAAAVKPLADALQLDDAVQRQLDAKCAEAGVLLFSDFWAIAGPAVRGERVVAVAAQLWKCAACTYDNDPADGACQMCNALAPAKTTPPPQNDESWPCTACTFVNAGAAGGCAVCDAPKPAPAQAAPVEEAERGGRRIELTHVNGLVGARNAEPTVTAVVLTTVDAALAAPGLSGDAFEETVHTKWSCAIVEYPAGKPPSIKG